MPGPAPYVSDCIVIELARHAADMLAERADDGESIDSLQHLIDVLELSDVEPIVKQFGDLPVSRLISDTRIREQVESEKRRRARTGKDVRDLYHFFTIEVHSLEAQDRLRLLDALQDLHGVIASAAFEHAYRSATAPVPPLGPSSWIGYQWYLNDAPLGIGLRTLAARPTGKDVGFAELDEGWNLDHECLPKHHPRIFPATANGVPPFADHGTAVLGIVLAQPKQGAIEGIAPDATLKAVLSPANPNQATGIAPAIYFAIDKKLVHYGDVLLIELQNDEGLPMEVEPWVFRAISLAVSEGIVVVEVAGNGYRLDDEEPQPWNLDEVARDKRRAPAWQLESGTVEEGIPISGAILVGGCMAGLMPGDVTAHAAVETFNYGSRVDCYAWGRDVLTAGRFIPSDPTIPRPASPNQYYDFDFNGTSAAAAIVAGVAVAVQGMAKEWLNFPLPPAQLRQILRDGTCGTKVVAPDRDSVMPDLAKIAPRLLQLPDIQVRAFQADNGDGVTRRATTTVDSQSPDIIVLDTSSKDPQAEYGEGSITANAMAPSNSVVPNRPGFIYVRLRNRGDKPASDVRVRAYWSEHALDKNAPVEWQALPDSPAVAITNDGRLTVVGPIAWQVPSLSNGTQQIDLIVAAGGSADPRPEFPPVRDAGETGLSRHDLLRFVANNDNVGMRTINVAVAT